MAQQYEEELNRIQREDGGKDSRSKQSFLEEEHNSESEGPDAKEDMYEEEDNSKGDKDSVDEYFNVKEELRKN